MLKTLKNQVKSTDTVYTRESSFTSVGLGPAYDFSAAIDKGACAIKDGNNQRHFIIIRKRVSRQRGFLDGWGGRLYYLPGRKDYFIGGTDWVS